MTGADPFAFRRLVVRALLAGALGGLFLGVAGRAAMRAIALAAGLPGGFSLGGTLEVIATGLIIGLPAALVYVAVRRRLPFVSSGRGALFGALLLALLAVVPPPAARSASASVGRPWLTLLAFAPAFVLYGVIVEKVIRRRD